MEYTDDLTNLSYLNEPAGMRMIIKIIIITIVTILYSIEYNPYSLYAKIDLYILWYCIDCCESF
jgi:hypothetical protein